MATNYPVTIVIPVYGDWSSLVDCIESLKVNINPELHTVLMVNDCGPDVDNIERNIKKSIKGFKNFKYYRNDKNLGFVGTCNRVVLDIDKTDNDILLLNSDTVTTSGFVEELECVLHESPKNGAVTPRSNNATIATVPLSAAIKKDTSPEESYEIYKKIKPGFSRSTIVPVAHGFCMLIRRELIKKYGLFDTVFGKGYGEEVDFCQRIKAKGYRSLLANRAYVFHLEARSFSMEAKKKFIEANNEIIWKRYPEYRQSVRDYMESALLKEAAIELSVMNFKKSSFMSNVKKIIKSNKTANKLIRKYKSNK